MGLLARLFLSAALSAGTEVWVDNVAGRDANGGTRQEPVRSVARGLSLLRGGGSLHLVVNDEPYREQLVLTERHSGTAERPTVVDGHGAVFDGLIVQTNWTAAGEGVWSRRMPNNAHVMDRSGCWRGAFPLVVFNGVAGVNCTNLETLVEGGYFLYKSFPNDSRQNTLYVKCPGGEKPSGCRVEVLSGCAGIGVERCAHVVVRNVTCRNTVWDCFETTMATNAIFESIVGLQAMDQGVSSHGSTDVVVRRSRFAMNAGGDAVDVPMNGLPCSVTYEDCVFEDNTFRGPLEFYGLARPGAPKCVYTLRRCVIRPNVEDKAGVRPPYRALNGAVVGVLGQ